MSRSFVLFLSFAFVLTVTQPSRAQGQALYLPALQVAGDSDLGVALVNSDSAAASVRLTARSYDGSIIQEAGITNPVTLNIPAAGKIELRTSDIFGSGISKRTGWLQLNVSTPAVKAFSFVFDSALSFVEGAPLTSAPSSRLVFPKISARAMTRLNLVNTAAQTVDVNVSFYENSGRFAGTWQLTMPALSGISGMIIDLARVDENFEGYAVVQTGKATWLESASLVGSETYRNKSDIAVQRAVQASALLTNGYWTHFVSQGGYTTQLTLVNPTDQPQVLQISAYTPAAVTVTRTLLPNERLEESARDMFRLSGDAIISGYIHFETQGNTPGVIGVLDYGTTTGSFLSAAEAQTQPVSDVYLTHLAEGGGYYTGLALLNPNGEAATVFLDVFDQAGGVTASSSVELNPSEHKAGLLSELFQQRISQIGGYMRLSSTRPVFALELLGSEDAKTFLANIAVQGDEVASSFTVSRTNPEPSIVSITPSTALIDNLKSLNVRIAGTGFTGASVVNFDGVNIRTRFVSSTLLAITLLNAQLKAGNHAIQVVNPAPGGGISNSVQLLLTSKTQPIINQAPKVNAGADQTITLPETAGLNGTASDDGLPAGSTLKAVWTNVSGPGTVTFAMPNSPSTSASFSVAGTYVLRLTASDSALSTSDDVLIAVSAPPPAPAPVPAPEPTGVYYVATTGSDSNAGTSTAPWKTIQKAANTLKAGETAIVNAGTYSERVQMTQSGVSGGLITLQAQGAVAVRGFNVQGSYIKVDGFEITNVGGSDLFNRAASSGVYMSGSFNEISNNYVHGTNAAGIYLTTSASGDKLTSNRVESAVEAGIYIQGTNHTIVSNDISHTVQTHAGMSNSSDADGIRFFGSGSTFRKNYIHDITLADAGNTNPHIDAFQTWGPCSNMIIEQNTILQMESPDQGIIIEGLDQPVRDITIRNNIFMTNGTRYAPAVLAGDVGTVSNIYIVNNTMVALNGPSEYAVWLFKNIQTAVVKNNAMYDHGTTTEPYIRVDSGATGLDIGFNSISKSDGKPPAGSPYPKDLWMVNPQFVDFAAHDFHLQATSPLINAGILLSIAPNDFDGISRPVGTADDIGAFEKQ